MTNSLDEKPLLGVANTWQRVYTVDADTLATRYGGDSDVLATPVIVYWIELLATACIRDANPGHYRSLGQAIKVQHLAQAPLGSTIVLELTLSMVFGHNLRFTAEVKEHSTGMLIAQGTHDRVLAEI